MKKQILILLFVLPITQFAYGGVQIVHAPIDSADMDSVKRGAKYFVEYCFGCHSAKYMRFNRIGRDTGMSDAELRENLIFTKNAKGEPSKLGALMTTAMSDDYARQAFGIVAPDLTHVARTGGVDWLYTYMKSFYADPNRPTGVNNAMYRNVRMPHVLAPLQGVQKAVNKTVERRGIKIEVINHLELEQPGSMDEEEYDAFITDLVNFMVYLSEPVQNERKNLGWKVMIYLTILLVFAYLLKNEYWKDVH
ncbi:MAG: cytochrome c1 [Gammaproteobacteria bacterium]|nr:cytochrome c1 [Gammaproteobacteria bacterium]